MLLANALENLLVTSYLLSITIPITMVFTQPASYVQSITYGHYLLSITITIGVAEPAGCLSITITIAPVSCRWLLLRASSASSLMHLSDVQLLATCDWLTQVTKHVRECVCMCVCVSVCVRVCVQSTYCLEVGDVRVLVLLAHYYYFFVV